MLHQLLLLTAQEAQIAPKFQQELQNGITEYPHVGGTHQDH